jgi:DNA-binding NarL/FixJ family response regulator
VYSLSPNDYQPAYAGRDREQRAAEIGLTPRELTVLTLLAEGLTAGAASRRLSISPHTVTKHLENIYRKLDTHDRLATVMLARELELLPDTAPPCRIASARLKTRP